MKRLALGAALTLALSSLAAPAMAAEPVPNNQVYSLTAAPVEPSPSHHKIKPPAPGKHGDLYQLVHGGFKDGASPTTTAADAADSTDKAVEVSAHSAPVLLKAGVIVAKVAKAKALAQPKQAKQPKQATAKTQKQPAPAKVVGSKQPKTTKATKAMPPAMTPQQAQQYAFQNPPRVRPKVIH